jgi:DNA-binding protein H-NS
MKIPNLKNMSADDLIDLRSAIDQVLAAKVAAERKELRAKLDKLERFGGRKAGGRRAHPLKGGRVAPRYRGPNGETWSGRGLRPRWLSALVAEGHKPEEFAIDTAAVGRGRPAGRKNRRRSARK